MCYYIVVQVKWELGNGANYWNEDTLMGDNGGLILSVGFVPDLKVDVIPLLRSKTVSNFNGALYMYIKLC